MITATALSAVAACALRHTPPLAWRAPRVPRQASASATDTMQELEPGELLVAVREGAFDAASHAALAGRPVSLRLGLRPASDSASDACREEEPAATLLLCLPPGYPASQALQVAGLASAGLGRQWGADTAGRLQQMADAAAAGVDGSSSGIGSSGGGGQECLYPLLEAALEAAQQALEAQRQAALQQQAQQQAQQAQQRGQEREAGGRTMALLKLDHMHDRASYSRTIRRWAAELGLGGRLAFCGGGGGGGTKPGGSGGGGGGGGANSGGASGIILILLEGGAAGVQEYLLRQRTQLMDVDSRGRWVQVMGLRLGGWWALVGEVLCVASQSRCFLPRPCGSDAGAQLMSSLRLALPPPPCAPASRPCRERMMRVLAAEARPRPDRSATAAAADGCIPSSGGAGGSSSSSSSSDCGPVFADFQAVELSVPELAVLLRAAGLAEHWGAATGLPGPPPA